MYYYDDLNGLDYNIPEEEISDNEEMTWDEYYIKLNEQCGSCKRKGNCKYYKIGMYPCDKRKTKC